MSARDGARWAGRVAAIVVVVLLVAASVPGPPPTHDGPQHIAVSYLARHLGDGLQPRFLVANLAVSNLAFDTLFGALDRFLGWRNAFRCVALLGAGVWTLGVWLLARRRPTTNAWLWLAVALAFPWHFYMGFYSFWLASGASLVLFAAAERVPVERLPARCALGALGLLLSLLHVFPALLVSGAIVVVGWFGPRHVSPQRRTLGVAVTVLPAVLWAAYTALAVGTDPGHTAEQEATWLAFGDQIALLGDALGAGPRWRTMPIAAAAILAATVGIVRGTRAERALGAFAILLLVLGVAMPMHLPSWYFFAPRFLLLGVVLGLAAVPSAVPSRTWERWVAPAAGLLALGWTVAFHRELTERARPFSTALTQPVPKRGRTLPIMLDVGHGGIAYASPFVEFGQLFLVEQGGMNPYLFASKRAVHPILYKAPLEDLFPEFPPLFVSKTYGRGVAPPEAERAWLASLAAKYDDVILYGRSDADVEYFLSRGFAADYRDGRLLLARYMGCTVDLRRTRAVAGATSFSYVFWPMVDAAGDVTVPASQPRAAVQLPCGPIRLRLVEDEATRGKHCINWPDGVTLEAKIGAKTHITCELE